MTHMSHQKSWRCHAVRSLPFLLGDIQGEKWSCKRTLFFLWLNEKIRQCARILEDNFLIGELSAGDMVILDAMYHAKCLIALYNKANQQLYGRDYNDNEKHLQGIVLAKLASFTEQTANTVDGVLKLTDRIGWSS